MKFILWLLAGLYALVVGLWPAAAAPIVLAATGAFTVLAQPPVFLAALVAGLLLSGRRRPAAKAVA
ncbi:hypothetical protein TUSST3_09070 [Streptomyces sp. TUS-ST3]|uniref:hypothetical protein n=1 Tax=Streptomyces sp. TUS-ST3 TaxID=3025591 RepID=UPI0024E0B416|nr:hypothetical protein [Streptomyces sp. TUS-ST3]GLP64287.1 hypothetical protein TUSST3_09070 [Streptomyces sp. TUS-ST3]